MTFSLLQYKPKTGDHALPKGHHKGAWPNGETHNTIKYSIRNRFRGHLAACHPNFGDRDRSIISELLTEDLLRS